MSLAWSSTCHVVVLNISIFAYTQLDNARFHVILENKETHEYVGWLTLRDEDAKNRNGDIAITIKQDAWGKGYGTEAMKFVVDYAFRALNLHRVSLGVFDTNGRAQNLYKKLYVPSLFLDNHTITSETDLCFVILQWIC